MNELVHVYKQETSRSLSNFILIADGIYVTGFGKTLRMGFFVKTEFDASLISSTLELTHLQV